jgi:hypothetical protein
MAYGIEPVLPFDIALSTFLIPNLTDKLSTADLIATHAQQLQRHKNDLIVIHSNVVKSCLESICQFKHQFENTIHNYDFGPGAFVLIWNLSVESDLGCKAKPCYMRPMIVLHHMQNGSYRLAELDGIVLNLCFAAFHLVPYHSLSHSLIPVTCLVNHSDLACVNTNEDVTRADSNDI